MDPEFSHEAKAVASFQFSAKPMKSKSPSLPQIQRGEWPLTTEVGMTPGFSSATPYWMCTPHLYYFMLHFRILLVDECAVYHMHGVVCFYVRDEYA